MFEPRLDIWPPAQRVLWLKLDATYEHFTLNGGTALDTRIAAGRWPRHTVRGAGAGARRSGATLGHVRTINDLKALRGTVGEDENREVLEQAPPDIFDARSWDCWNLVCGRKPSPPLPVRTELLLLPLRRG